MDVLEYDIEVAGGRSLHCYVAGRDDSRFSVFWHHGTPNIGLPPEPLFGPAERLGIRFVSFDRPGYGGSDPLHRRTIASVVDDIDAIGTALGMGEFAAMGQSGGGPHALACAALSKNCVAAVSMSGLAPYDADDFDWFAGMAPASVLSLRAAVAGRDEKARHEAEPPDADFGLTDSDIAALQGTWGWFERVVGPAMEKGPGGLIDDDLAYVGPWGFDPSGISVPVLLVHGEDDRVVPSSHSLWLSGRIETAETWILPERGHISIMESADAALRWLVETV